MEKTISKVMRVAVAVVMTAPFFGAGCGSSAGDQLVGTWKRLRSDATVRDQYTFGANGSFAFDEFIPDAPASEDHMVGTYTASATTVVATVTNALDGSHGRLTFSYYANATSLSTAALRPAGAHQGIVGTWEGQVLIDNLGSPPPVTAGTSETDIIRADKTFQATSTPNDGSPVLSWAGTYVEQSPGLFVMTGPSGAGGERTVTWQLVDGTALVDPDRIWLRE